MVKRTLRFCASSNRFSASVLREELLDTAGELRPLPDGRLSSLFWNSALTVSGSRSSVEISSFGLDFFFFLVYLFMLSWTDQEWMTHFFTMPPSATPPLNLREPPGRMLYSDMSDRDEVTEFEYKPLLIKGKITRDFSSSPSTASTTSTGHNHNGRSIVTVSPYSIYSSSYAYFHTCNYHINRVLCILMVERDGSRGSTLFDTGPRIGLIRSLDALHICACRNFSYWGKCQILVEF